MSNYRALAYHPTSGRLEVVTFIDTGAQYVVRCDDGASATAGDDFRRPDPVDLFLIAQEMAEALAEIDNPNPAPAKWRDFTNAKEKTDG